jgi:thiamine-triphosphatase
MMDLPSRYDPSSNKINDSTMRVSFLLPLLILLNGMPKQTFVRAFLALPVRLSFPLPTKRTKRTAFVRRGMTTTTTLEVEQKFALLDSNLEDIKARLSQAGFQLDNVKEMVDWYFDVEGSVLTRHDCWLRYRQLLSSDADQTGQWELKRGQPRTIRRKGEAESTERNTLTVYEEIEGAAAVTTACSVLSDFNFSASFSSSTPNTTETSTSNFQDYLVPQLGVTDTGLEPFARIVTQRSSWKSTDKFNWENLSVDLDTTDFGYAVGEVERVVHRQEDVEAARTQVHALIAEICNGVSDPAVGKLEYFLKRNRPDIYQACVESGTIPVRV